MKHQLKLFCGVAALALAGQAVAATTWTLRPGPDPTTSGGVNAYTVGDANTAVDLQMLETQTSSLYTGGIGITNNDACSTSGCSGGYGDATTPEHAIDNNGRYEMALVSFKDQSDNLVSVNLTGLTIGWSKYDSDMTVLAYKGTGTATLVGKTYAELAADNDWKKIGNYQDVGSTSSTEVGGSLTITTDVSSSFWLIGAYNPIANPIGTWDDTTSTTSCSWSGCKTTTTQSYDYIKLSPNFGYQPTPSP